MTDNGSAYRITIHALACRALGIRHLRTRPSRPQTNGKAERFIRTLQAGWAYGAIYATSAERTAALDGDEAAFLRKRIGEIAIDSMHELIDRAVSDAVRPDAHVHGPSFAWRMDEPRSPSNATPRQGRAPTVRL